MTFAKKSLIGLSILLGITLLGCTARVATSDLGPLNSQGEEQTQAEKKVSDKPLPTTTETGEYIYTMPFAVGSKHMIGQGYHGMITHFGNMAYATDWSSFDDEDGEEILAVRDGVVTEVVNHFGVGGIDDEYYSKINYVVIKHADGTSAYYGHNLKNTAKVKVGQKVKVGTVLAQVGCSGFCASPHLHFEIFKYNAKKEKVSLPVVFRIDYDKVGEIIQGIRYTVPGDQPLPDLAANLPADSLARFPEKVLKEVRRYDDRAEAALAYQKFLQNNEKKLKKLWQKMQEKAMQKDPSALAELDVLFNYSLPEDHRFDWLFKPVPYNPETGDGGAVLPGISEGHIVWWGMASPEN
jgi:murein DD-endopeptidase MepM/ murein hydrolase activator NlpD